MKRARSGSFTPTQVDENVDYQCRLCQAWCIAHPTCWAMSRGLCHECLFANRTLEEAKSMFTWDPEDLASRKPVWVSEWSCSCGLYESSTFFSDDFPINIFL